MIHFKQQQKINFVCLQLVFAAITALVSSAPAPEPGYLGGYSAGYAAPYSHGYAAPYSHGYAAPLAVAHHAPIVGGYP